jgi:hypothetical protein
VPPIGPPRHRARFRYSPAPCLQTALRGAAIYAEGRRGSFRPYVSPWLAPHRRMRKNRRAPTVVVSLACFLPEKATAPGRSPHCTPRPSVGPASPAVTHPRKRSGRLGAEPRSLPRHHQSFKPSGAVECYITVRLVASFEPPSISGNVPVPAFDFRQLREPGPVIVGALAGSNAVFADDTLGKQNVPSS